MFKSILRLSIVVALGLALGGSAVRGQTNTTESTAGSPAPAAPTSHKANAGPFHGKLAAVDHTAKTITVGKRTFQITSETKIFKDAQPATLSQAVVGEPASGYFKAAADGKLVATKLNLGAKAESSKKESKKSE